MSDHDADATGGPAGRTDESVRARSADSRGPESTSRGPSGRPAASRARPALVVTRATLRQLLRKQRDSPLLLAIIAGFNVFLGAILVGATGTGGYQLGVGLAAGETAAVAERVRGAVLSGLVRRGGRFARTPKFRIESRVRSWRGRAYDRPLGTTAPELLLGGWCAAGAALAVASGALGTVPSLSFFAASFWGVVVVAWRQR